MLEWAVDCIGITWKAAEAIRFGSQVKLFGTLISAQWKAHSHSVLWDF